MLSKSAPNHLRDAPGLPWSARADLGVLPARARDFPGTLLDVPSMLRSAPGTFSGRFWRLLGHLQAATGAHFRQIHSHFHGNAVSGLIFSDFLRLFDVCAYRFFCFSDRCFWYLFAKLSTVFWFETGVAGRARDSSQTSIFLRMASVSSRFRKIARRCASAKNDERSDRKARTRSIDKAWKNPRKNNRQIDR